jgi:hypothetical protein
VASEVAVQVAALMAFDHSRFWAVFNQASLRLARGHKPEHGLFLPSENLPSHNYMAQMCHSRGNSLLMPVLQVGHFWFGAAAA